MAALVDSIRPYRASYFAASFWGNAGLGSTGSSILAFTSRSLAIFSRRAIKSADAPPAFVALSCWKAIGLMAAGSGFDLIGKRLLGQPDSREVSSDSMALNTFATPSCSQSVCRVSRFQSISPPSLRGLPLSDMSRDPSRSFKFFGN